MGSNGGGRKGSGNGCHGKVNGGSYGGRGGNGKSNGGGWGNIGRKGHGAGNGGGYGGRGGNGNGGGWSKGGRKGGYGGHGNGGNGGRKVATEAMEDMLKAMAVATVAVAAAREDGATVKEMVVDITDKGATQDWTTLQCKLIQTFTIALILP